MSDDEYFEHLKNQYDELQQALKEGSYFSKLINEIREEEFRLVTESAASATEAHYNLKALAKIEDKIYSVKNQYETELLRIQQNNNGLNKD